MTILIICVYALNRNKHAELYIPCMFQTSDIELLTFKIEPNMHLAKSPKGDHIYNCYKLGLYMLEEQNCGILTS